MTGNHSENPADLPQRVAEGLRAWLTLTERRQLRRVRMWDPGFSGSRDATIRDDTEDRRATDECNGNW